MKRTAVSVCTLAIVALVAGCASAERGSQPGFTRTDSAGVVVAMNAARVGDLQPVFTVSPDPCLRIGVEEGAEEVQFTDIRSMMRLPDGRIAVASGQPTEIRIFSETGAFVTRHGRQGQGPGEFQYLSRLLPGGGDTLLAVNDPRFQLLRFTAGGGYVDMTVASRDSMQRQLGGMRFAEGVHEYFRDGSVVIAARPPSGEGMDGDQYRTGELFRPTTTLVWIARDYARSQVIGEFGEIQQMFIDVGGGRREPVVPPSARRRMSILGGAGDRFCVAGNEIAEIRCLDQDGSRLVIRWSQDSVPTTQAAIDEWRQSERARAARPGAHTTPEAICLPSGSTSLGPTTCWASRAMPTAWSSWSSTTSHGTGRGKRTQGGRPAGIRGTGPPGLHHG